VSGGSGRPRVRRAGGDKMELVVLLCLLAACWTRWFWTVQVLWTLAESVLILRRWESEVNRVVRG